MMERLPGDVNNHRIGQHMHHHMNKQIPLNSSTGENELKILPVLESDRVDGNDIYYTIEAIQGETDIFEGIKTKTLGYKDHFSVRLLSLKKVKQHILI